MLKVGFIFLVSLAALVCGNGKGNGFGDQYEWYNNLSEGLAVSKSSGKPALVIIHQSWCPRCQELKPVFAGSQDIKALSKRFVFINCEDDEEPEEPEYAPDGSYYQRILFVSPSKGVLKQIYCEGGSPEYRHWYTESDQIVKSMNKVLRASRRRNK